LWEKERDKEWKPNIGEENKKKREKEFEQITKYIYIYIYIKRRLGFLKVRTQPLGASHTKKKREKRGKKK
jgi:hypothetical protein